jgi:hypothetical protein
MGESRKGIENTFQGCGYFYTAILAGTDKSASNTLH